MPRALLTDAGSIKISYFQPAFNIAEVKITAPLLVLDFKSILMKYIINTTDMFYVPDLVTEELMNAFEDKDEKKKFEEEFEVAGEVLRTTMRRIKEVEGKALYADMLSSKFFYVNAVILLDVDKLKLEKPLYHAQKFFKDWILKVLEHPKKNINVFEENALQTGVVEYVLKTPFFLKIQDSPIIFSKTDYAQIFNRNFVLRINGEKQDWEIGDILRVDYINKTLKLKKTEVSK